MNEIMVEEERNRQLRREAFIRRILDGLRATIELRGKTPETPVNDVYVELTDVSARYIAPLIEAVHILEEIIFASDGCMGHRHCVHSMEPWTRARTLLEGKWKADTGQRSRWPDLDERSTR